MGMWSQNKKIDENYGLHNISFKVLLCLSAFIILFSSIFYSETYSRQKERKKIAAILLREKTCNLKIGFYDI